MKKDSWNPDQYEKFKNERSQPFLDLIGMLQPTEHAKVIDLGSGTGELTELLHKSIQAKTTVGFERSDAMLAKANALSAPGLSFVKGDIESWLPTETFDIVISNAALQWCHYHPQIFSKIRKALNPGGQIAIQMPMNHDYPTHVIAQKMSQEPYWRQLLNGEVYNKFDSMLEMEEYAQLLFKLGFQKQNVLTKVYPHVLESREGVIEWVKGSMLTHFQSRLSATDYENFLKEFRERLFQELPDERPFFYPFKRMFIWGRCE